MGRIWTPDRRIIRPGAAPTHDAFGRPWGAKRKQRGFMVGPGFWNSGSSGPAQPGTLFLSHFEGGAFTDSSSNHWACTLNANGSISSAQAKYGTGSLLSNGGSGNGGGYVTISSGTPNAQSWTIDTQFYSSSFATGNTIILDTRPAGGNYGGFAAYVDTSGKLSVYSNYAGASTFTQSSSTALTANAWNFCRVVWDNSGGTLSMYLNGSLVAGPAGSGGCPFGSTTLGSNGGGQWNWGKFRIGWDSFNSAQCNAYFDEYRIVVGYALGTGNQTAPWT